MLLISVLLLGCCIFLNCESYMRVHFCCCCGGGGGGDVSHAHVPVSGIKKYNTNATTKELYYS